MEIPSMISFARSVLAAYDAYSLPLCREFRMPQTALDILMFLGDHPDYPTACELSRQRVLRPNLVSGYVDKLVQEGYVERLSFPGNRKKVCLQLTEKALPIWKRGRDLRQTFLRELLDDISCDDLQRHWQVMCAIESNSRRIYESAHTIHARLGDAILRTMEEV